MALPEPVTLPLLPLAPLRSYSFVYPFDHRFLTPGLISRLDSLRLVCHWSLRTCTSGASEECLSVGVMQRLQESIVRPVYPAARS